MNNENWFLLTIGFIIAGTGVASKPDPSTFRETLSLSQDSAFGSPSQFANETLTEEIQELECSVVEDGCEDVIRSNLYTDYTDIVVANVAEVTFDGHDVATCIGTAKMWLCFGD